jgi:hypothetical protein
VARLGKTATSRAPAGLTERKHKLLKAAMAGVAPVLKNYEARIAQLEKRLAQLEQRGGNREVAHVDG